MIFHDLLSFLQELAAVIIVKVVQPVNTMHSAYRDEMVPPNVFVLCVPRYTNPYVEVMVPVMPVHAS